ncbi:MAG: metallophosphoesterase [Spirochaetia bacterium]|nr:metallophosphoesterase [Spirochaetia bacterium]
MKILSVSDRECDYLFSQLEKNPGLGKTFDLVASCGDLRDETVMRLADLTNKIVLYVDGNHFFYDAESRAANRSRFKDVTTDIPGARCAHLKLIPVGNALVCGFSGSLRYKDGPGQYTESEMRRNVRLTLLKLRWHRIKERLAGKKPSPLIVLSHAPIKNLGDGTDLPHQGFEAFDWFIRKAKPILWIHGHVHLADFKEMRNFELEKTKVVNTYEFKTIEIAVNGIHIGFHLPGE